MATEITTTSIDKFVAAEELSRDLQDAARPLTVMMGLVQEGIIPTGTKTLALNRRVASTSWTSRTNDTTEMARVDYVPTQKTLTATTVGRQRFIAKESRAASTQPLIPVIVSEDAADMAEKIDTDILALVASLSNSVGTSGVQWDLQTWLTGMYKLATLKVRPPYVSVLAPLMRLHLQFAIGGQAGSLASAYANSSVAQALGPAGAGGFCGELMGVGIYETTQVPTVNAAVDYGGVMMGVGLNSPFILAWTQNDDGSLWLPTVEYDRAPEYIADRIVTSARYGVAERATSDERGILLLDTATV